MRLSTFQIQTIKLHTSAVFGAFAKVYLFGSRVHDAKKGGDIDLLVCADDEIDNPRSKVNALHIKLIMALGDQKIDILVKNSKSQQSIIDTALKTGIEL